MTETSDNTPNDQTSARAVPDYGDSADSREFPGFFDLLRPRYLWAWTWNFIEGWFVSRPYSRLFAATPFLLIATVGLGFVWWLRNAPQDDVVTRYENAIKAAIKADNPIKTGLYLRGLTALRPHDHRYRFQLALHQLENGNSSRAVSNLVELTTGKGYMPAQMWLIEQAISPNPLLPLADEILEKQLRVILSKEPANFRANHVLADLYLRKGRLKAAEDRLLTVVNRIPAIGLPLAKVQRLLNRNEEQVSRHLNNAEESFRDRLVQNPDDVQSRIHRAETLTLLQQFPDAERVLKEGRALQDSPELRSALAQLYAGLARLRLSESILNREVATKLLVKAISLNPQNKPIIRQAVQLTNGRTGFPGEAFVDSIQFLKDEASQKPQDRLLLAETLAASGSTQKAIDIVTPLAEENHQLRPILVRLLKTSGRMSEAQVLVQTILNEQPNLPDEQSTSEHSEQLLHAVSRAEILNLADRFSESVSLLETHPVPNDREPDSSATTTLRRRWNILYVQACLACFDEEWDADSFDSAAEAMEMLDKILQTNRLPVAVLERLVKVSCTRDEFAEAADQRLTKILASGTVTPTVYNLLGTWALQLDQPAKARQYLERAWSFGRNNPMVLNNLAIALVRDTSGDPERALQIANDALKLLPEHPDVLSTRGEVYVALKRWEDARRDLEVSLPQRPKSRNTRTLLIKVYEELGQPDLAAEHRRRLAQMNATPAADVSDSPSTAH